MKNHYIKFYGDKRQVAIAISVFEVVCCYQYNTRPLKEYTHQTGRVVEYPSGMKKFNEFYQVALRHLHANPDFDGRLPRIVIPT